MTAGGLIRRLLESWIGYHALRVLTRSTSATDFVTGLGFRFHENG